MRIVLESFRFVFIVLMLGTVLSVISYMILYPMIGNFAESYYGWTAVMSTFVILYFLYRNKGWAKDLNKSILWLSVIFIVLLSLLIPDLTPEHLHTTKYAYSYGFPFRFLTLHIESGTKFLMPNLFLGRITSWNVSMGGTLGNFILFYCVFRLVFLKLSNKTVDEKSSEPMK